MMAYGMTDIAEKIQDFLVYLKYEKQYSSATLKNYNLEFYQQYQSFQMPSYSNVLGPER